MSLLYKKSLFFQQTSLVLVILVVFLASAVRFSLCDDSDSVRDSVGEQSGGAEYANLRHQYLFGPRLSSRSGATTFWSALEEGALGVPTSIRSFPSPARASLLFLVGNRRMIGPRSGSGLLPQARIGRRASPIGLMPQPRVGRRSDPDSELDGQQEVAIASLSDSSSTDALESLVGV